MAHLSKQVDSEIEQTTAAAFTIGDVRTYDGDPRFGLVVLAEIASKALSPGINDPGPAIGVIGTLVRLLARPRDRQLEEPRFAHVSMEELDPADVVEDTFRPIARDGAATIEVVLRLLQGLQAFAAGNQVLAPATRDMMDDVTERARLALTASRDKAALHAIRSKS